MAFLKNPTAHMLASAIKGENEYKKLVSSLSGYRIKNFKQPPAFVTGLSDTPFCALAASVCDEFSEKSDFSGTSMIIAPDEKSAAYMRDLLSAMSDGVYLFPMRDFVFHNIEAFSHDTEFERLEILRKISEGQAKIVIAVPEAALSLLPPPENMADKIELFQGAEYPIEKLLEKLCLYGYSEADTVEGKGQFSHRGDIVDVFPPDAEYPVRLEFFGDEIDACGYFDILTQRRLENVQKFEITPSREIMLTNEQKEKCLSALTELVASCEKRLAKAKKSGEKLDVLSLETTLDNPFFVWYNLVITSVRE